MKSLSDQSISDLKATQRTLEAELRAINQSKQQKVQQMEAVKAEIICRALPKGAPQISDHALLRYMERVMGFDVEVVRKKMLKPEVVSEINAGAQSVKIDGLEMKIRERVITTVVK
jgi:hypothetical protein